MRLQARPWIALGLVFTLAGCSSDDEGSAASGTGAGGAGGTGGTGGTGGAAGAGLTFETLPTRIAFGSCFSTLKSSPALDLATESNPDLFVFLGDNIYGDTLDMAVLSEKYQALTDAPEFQKLQASGVEIIATWDDHDYGENDAGKNYPMRDESEQIFLDFWEEPAGSERRSRPGVYTSYMHEEHNRKLQVILLDTRYFRDDLTETPPNDPVYVLDYRPSENPDDTFLGAAQWAWLEDELKKPADLRIIGSSNQFSHEYNGYESWTNMPHEQQRMIDLIASTRANGVLFISGDVHWGEISKRPAGAGGYDLWDVTSSGLNQSWPFILENKYRVGEASGTNNYGYIEVGWSEADPSIEMGIIDKNNAPISTMNIKLSELAFPE